MLYAGVEHWGLEAPSAGWVSVLSGHRGSVGLALAASCAQARATRLHDNVAEFQYAAVAARAVRAQEPNELSEAELSS